MNSFQPLRIEEAGAVADQQRDVGGGGGDGKISALGNRLRAVANHLPAFEQPAQPRMCFPLLESVVRVKARVLVIEAGDESDGKLRGGERINESAAELAFLERPAGGMNHLARTDAPTE